MTFIHSHEPKCFDDLVFQDPRVEQILREYNEGERKKHLLLHGPKGSGKSCAARMILCNRLGSEAEAKFAYLNGRVDEKRKSWDIIWKTWGFQRGSEDCSYFHIDEVDRYSEKLRDQLDEFLDKTTGTLIMTTNHIEELDEWFTDRCRVLEIHRPQLEDLLQRSCNILAKEGYEYTEDEVRSMLAGFAGSLRTLVEWLEDKVLANKAVADELGEASGDRSQHLLMPISKLQPGRPRKRVLTVNGSPA